MVSVVFCGAQDNFTNYDKIIQHFMLYKLQNENRVKL